MSAQAFVNGLHRNWPWFGLGILFTALFVAVLIILVEREFTVAWMRTCTAEGFDHVKGLKLNCEDDHVTIDRRDVIFGYLHNRQPIRCTMMRSNEVTCIPPPFSN